MDNPIGSCTYSLMLNEAGGIEADITVTRISEDAFYIITGAAFTHYVHERVMTSPSSLYIILKTEFLTSFAAFINYRCKA